MQDSIDKLRDACITEPRIDTHAHLMEDFPSLSEQAQAWEHFETTQQLIDSRIAAEGCRKLYGEDIGVVVRPDVSQSVLDASVSLRERGAWQAIAHALNTARITKQIAFCGFNPEESRPFADEAPPGRLAYLAYIDSVINGTGMYPCPDHPQLEGTYYDHLCAQLGPLPDLDAYLAALDAGIDQWRSFGVVGMKTAIAYTSGLAISDPEEEDVRSAFSRKNDMTEGDIGIVRDYAFRHILKACLRNNLPVVIHTGFQIWGHAPLPQSNPMLLHNIISDTRYRDLTFALLHGGNPYVGETTYLAGMFSNVIIDFTWISWMTPARFRLALGEWLACVPHDRMCWGSDSITPESIAGINSVVRHAVADVVEQAFQDRLIDERYGHEFILNTCQNTPRRVFGL